MRIPLHTLGSAFLIIIPLAAASGAAPSTAGAAHVDGGMVSFSPQERNLMVACVMSELGQWDALGDDNVRDKAAAISYVILRRALRGDSHGPRSIAETLLAYGQFTGVSLKEPHSGGFRGKPEVHAALASLDPAYRKEIIDYGQSHHDAYLRDVFRLMPSDTARSNVAQQFQRDLQDAEAGVDGALSGNLKDVTDGAMFFGGLPDLYSTRDHEPSHLVAAVGGLGPYPNVKALLADPQIRSKAYRVELGNKNRVDAILFFR